jgi:hypothetical protein
VPVTTDLIDLERAGWEALSTSGDAAAAFFERVLAAEPVVVLPGGTVIVDRDEIVASMRGEPWSSYEITEPRVVRVGPEAAVVVYRGRARREGMSYEALFASTYARVDDGWRMVVHQQTPA